MLEFTPSFQNTVYAMYRLMNADFVNCLIIHVYDLNSLATCIHFNIPLNKLDIIELVLWNPDLKKHEARPKSLNSFELLGARCSAPPHIQRI